MATALLEGLNARRIVRALERIAFNGGSDDEGSGGGGDIEPILPDDYQELAEIVQAGEAQEYFEIGDQIDMKYTYEGNEYDMPWDVIGFAPVTDDEGVVHQNAMWLQSHYAVPAAPFTSKQVFYVPTSDMPAGNYYFDYQIATKVHSITDIQKKWFKFRTTEVIPADSQLVLNSADGDFYNGDYYNNDCSTWVIDVYGGALDKTPLKRYTVTNVLKSSVSDEKTLGTKLGSCGVSGVYPDMNTPSQMLRGDNRWYSSPVRQWLNSAEAKDKWWLQIGDKFDRRPAALSQMDGFITGLPAGFAAIIKPVKVATHLNTIEYSDLGNTEYTFDRFFNPAIVEEYVKPELAGEGDPAPYWTERLGTRQERSVSDARKEHIKYKITDTSTPMRVCFRSPYRTTDVNMWFLSDTGYVYYMAMSHGEPVGEYWSTPVCVIY